jgi:hypothetical protein
VTCAAVLTFPARGPFAVDIERERDGEAWLVRCRSHGWLHGSSDDALKDARAIAHGFNVAVRRFGIHLTTGRANMTEQRDNSGIAFKNDRKQTDKSPDFMGDATISGIRYQIAAWVKAGKGGKFLTFSFRLKNEEHQEHEATKSDDPL